MGPEPTNTPETLQLLDQIRQGDEKALELLLQRHREIVRQVVEMRMDPKIRGRLDPSDVVQEAQLEIAQRIHEYLDRLPMPFHLWLRQTTYQNLIRLRRQHVEAACRSVDNEMPLPERSSVLLIQRLLGNDPDPAQKMIESELTQRVHAAIAEMTDIDREILVMRHVEEMDNQEVALVLGLDPKTASKRHGRALLKLQKQLAALKVGDSNA